MNSYLILIMILLSYLIIIPLIRFVLMKDIIVLHKYRLITIDGLRGYLAISIFYHHYIINYYWHIDGVWKVPPFQWVTNIGQVSVALFFIITGYLFSKKIVSDKFNIKAFFINRFFRLAPLYYFVIFFMFIIVGFMSNITLESVNLELFQGLLKWMLFLQSELNGFSDTYKITSSVTWTLRYEWVFYLSLPIFFYMYKKKYLLYIILFWVSIFSLKEVKINVLDLFDINTMFFLLFIIGAIIVKVEKFVLDKEINFNHFYFSLLNLMILIILLFMFNTGYGLIQFILLGIFFTLVVLKNSLFGVLTWYYSRILGEISYSIYLLHGIIIYTLFSILSRDYMQITDYYLFMMPVVMFIIIAFSILTYIFIESPMILFGKKLIQGGDTMLLNHYKAILFILQKLFNRVYCEYR